MVEGTTNKPLPKEPGAGSASPILFRLPETDQVGNESFVGSSLTRVVSERKRGKEENETRKHTEKLGVRCDSYPF